MTFKQEPIYGTRRCHHCGRHSWHVADGNPCPWCGKRTGKHHHHFNAVMIIACLAGIIGAAYVIWRCV